MTAIRIFRQGTPAQSVASPLRQRLSGAARAAWFALQQVGQRHAAWHLEALADRHAPINPTLAGQLRRTAAECRAAATATVVHQPTRGSTS
jgi:hypothetical protein